MMTTLKENIIGGTQPDPSTWLDRHGDYLFRYAMFRLRDPMVAEDVLQETLLGAGKGVSRFIGASSERTWLVEILRSKIFDRFSELSRSRPLADGDDQFDNLDFQADGHWNPGSAPLAWHIEPYELIEREEFWGLLTDGLSTMPSETATAFILREVDGLQTDEICEALNISRENLWLMLHRARMTLRRFLENNWFAADSDASQHTGRDAKASKHLPIPTSVSFVSNQRLTA